jgi:hypothetical protein
MGSLAAAPSTAQELAHRLTFGAGGDAVGFVSIGGNVALQDGVCRQRVTVRVLVNEEVAGAIPNVDVRASNCRLLAHGPALLFLALTAGIDLEAQGERFGLTFLHLPPSPVRIDLDRLHPSVRTRIGSYVTETVAANANTIGATPPPVGDRRLRRLLIGTETMVRVPGNAAARPIDARFLGVIPPPTGDAAPRALFAVFVPPSALPPGPIRFVVEANAADASPGPGLVFQGAASAQPPPVGDVPPPVNDRPDRQYIAIPVPAELPPSPIRFTVTLRFADGTIGSAALVAALPPGPTVE